VGEPSTHPYRISQPGQTPDRSERQLHDECRTGGNQPANISMIYRRSNGPVPPLRENREKMGLQIKSPPEPLRGAEFAPGRLRRVTVGPILGVPPRLRCPSARFAARCRLKNNNHKGWMKSACILHPYQDGWSGAQPITFILNASSYNNFMKNLPANPLSP
jgi:hypothetical protein